MHNPFEVEITKLESTNFELEEIKSKVAQNITGGTVSGTSDGNVLYNPEVDVNLYPDPICLGCKIALKRPIT